MPVAGQVPFPSGPRQTLTAEETIKVASLILPLGNLTQTQTTISTDITTQNVTFMFLTSEAEVGRIQPL